jgi:hypothetical protein
VCGGNKKVRQKACRIQVEFDEHIHENIRQHRSNKSYAKTIVLNFIDTLIGEGYRHFIIYINWPTDLWIAELLFFMIPSYKPLNIAYTLGLWIDEDGMHYAWMENSACFAWEVLQAAKKIIWRQEEWYDLEYTLKYLKITHR